jgi:hypothetical protein
MGYDMRWLRADGSEKAAVVAASEVFQAACNARDALPEGAKGQFNLKRAKEAGDWDSPDAYDGQTADYRAAQEKVHVAYAALGDAEKSYFRLNIFGMGRYRDLMERLGMAFEDAPHPTWPEAEDYGLTKEQAWAATDPAEYPDVTLTPEQQEAGRKYAAEQDRILRWHGKEIPGIPLHKFGSNDGWVVLPAEAEAAVRIWAEFVKVNGDEKSLALVTESVTDTGYWLKWIAYLMGAVTHDGFAVR